MRILHFLGTNHLVAKGVEEPDLMFEGAKRPRCSLMPCSTTPVAGAEIVRSRPSFCMLLTALSCVQYIAYGDGTMRAHHTLTFATLYNLQRTSSP